MKPAPGEFLILATLITATWSKPVLVIGQEGRPVTLPNEDKGKEVVWKFGKEMGNINTQLVSEGKGMPMWGAGMRDRLFRPSNNASLTIKSLQKDDFGYYSCDISNVLTVYKLHKATVTPSPSSILLASQTLTLKCVVEDLIPSIEWLSPQKERQDTTFDTLIQNKVTSRHHGLWTCAVTYDGRRTDITTSISVLDLSPPQSHPLYTSVSSDLTLPCSTSNQLELSKFSEMGLKGGGWTFRPSLGTGAPRKLASLYTTGGLRWEKPSNGSGWAVKEETIKYNLSLIKAKVQVEDAGLYKCELNFNKNDITISKEVRVKVLRVISSNGSTVQEGRSINITCTLGQPMNADLSVMWKVPFKSSMKPQLKEPHPTVLSIPEVQETDKGLWRCELLQNGKLLTSAELLLKTEKAPVDVWLWVSVCGAVVAFILLAMVIVIIVQRLRQRAHFMRRRRKMKYCCCKHPQPKGFYRT